MSSVMIFLLYVALFYFALNIVNFIYAAWKYYKYKMIYKESVDKHHQNYLEGRMWSTGLTASLISLYIIAYVVFEM